MDVTIKTKTISASQKMNNCDSIDYLSPSLLSNYPREAKTVDLLRKALLKEIGWHYWIDLTWILAKLKEFDLPLGATILDAGAGNGLLQFLLSNAGYNVISVDFAERKFNLIHRLIFPIKSRKDVKEFNHSYIEHVRETSNSSKKPKRVILYLLKNWQNLFRYFFFFIKSKITRKRFGTITTIRSNIKDLCSIPESSVDAVVSCSVIEHLDPKDLPDVLYEFFRVVKKNQPIILTSSASEDEDWFHEPSLGWCFSISTLSNLFSIPINLENYGNFNEILDQYRNSTELRKRLPISYRLSGNNGMPWGIWDPKYIPVGISKKKL